MANNIQSHDQFFKKMMAYPKVAKQFFEFHLPENIKSKVDLNTLNPQKESFLNNTLGQGIVDLLFEVKYGEELGYFYILVEHQTNQDHFMPFRLYKYILRICDDHLKKYPKCKQLPLVYPMIFYAGLQKYTAPLDLWSLFADPKLAKSFYTEPFQLIDLQNIADEELRERAHVGIIEYVMKRIREKDILSFLPTLAEVLSKLHKEDLLFKDTILCYIIEKADSEYIEQVIEVLKDTEGDVMTIAERLIQKGKLEGKLEGIQEGIFKGKLEGKLEGIQEGIFKGIQEGKLEVARKMLAMGQDIQFVSQFTELSEDALKGLININ